MRRLPAGGWSSVYCVAAAVVRAVDLENDLNLVNVLMVTCSQPIRHGVCQMKKDKRHKSKPNPLASM